MEVVIRALVVLLFSIQTHALPLTCGSLFSAEKMKFGPEFTFTSTDLKKHESKTPTSTANAAARDRLADEIMKRCRARGLDCKRSRGFRKWFLGLDQIITYQDGFTIRVSTDFGAVEVQTSPATLAQFAERRELIEQDLFEAARSLGIEPDQSSNPNWGLTGGGHIHMGIEQAFEGNPILFRNFLVDLVNHGITKFGGRNTDAIAAPIRMDNEAFAPFRSVINDVDAGELKTITEIANAIQTRVYAAKAKNQAVNMSRIIGFDSEPGKQTIEFRGLDPQGSFDTFLRQIAIFEARIAYLKTIDGLIALNLWQMGEATGLYNYVTTAGLPWERFEDLWAPRLYNPKAFEPFKINVVIPFTKAAANLNRQAQTHPNLKSRYSLKTVLFRAIRPL